MVLKMKKDSNVEYGCWDDIVHDPGVRGVDLSRTIGARMMTIFSEARGGMCQRR